MVSGAGEAMPLAAQTSIIATIGGFGIFTTSECPSTQRLTTFDGGTAGAGKFEVLT